ncbi:MAG: transcriptional regulator [Actinobacteria bacterium HGW-Actinobacteria-4]|nr:MAG: transcriptional regulator [Actinobacteria bacterium HGW-Actinobacteria-4]
MPDVGYCQREDVSTAQHLSLKGELSTVTASRTAGSRNEHTHRRNLSAMLTMVHQRGSMTRAELTRATGLNRSTVGALVGELVALDLVAETDAPASRSVGRPSPLVTANPHVVAFAINPDIDAVVVGVVGLGGVVHGRVRIAAQGDLSVTQALDATEAGIGQLHASMARECLVMGVGVAVPGLVRSTDGTVTRAPHLEWTDVALRDLIATRTGLPTQVGNDAGVAMIAESVFGAGRGVTDLVYLNGSASGIGGAALVGGASLRGADGYAGELGHTLVNSDGIACHCGRRGCLETEVNLQRILAVTGEPDHGGQYLEHFPANGSTALHAELDRQADVLGHGIANLISVFNPEAVVLGGFLSALYEARPERIAQAVAADAFAPLADHVRIERAQLGENLLMVGAAELAFAALLQDPVGVASGT